MGPELIAISHKCKMMTFHIDGSGVGRDGKRSAWAWVRLDRDQQDFEWVDGLTKNQAVYGALLALVRYLAARREAVVYTDSKLVCDQFNRKRDAHDWRLRDALLMTRSEINLKDLTVWVRWIPRSENLARRLLDREKRTLRALPLR
jgi:ribonuclease HI